MLGGGQENRGENECIRDVRWMRGALRIGVAKLFECRTVTRLKHVRPDGSLYGFVNCSSVV